MRGRRKKNGGERGPEVQGGGEPERLDSSTYLPAVVKLLPALLPTRLLGPLPRAETLSSAFPPMASARRAKEA
eukprot:303096-Hanusia_phi.AAC.3